MRNNAKKVIEAFLRREPAVGDAKCTIHTDGEKIWSYRMLIAERKPDGTIWIVDRDQSPSVTTSAQIGACRSMLGDLRQSGESELEHRKRLAEAAHQRAEEEARWQSAVALADKERHRRTARLANMQRWKTEV